VDPEALERGIAELESLELRFRVTPGTAERKGFTAGPPESRLAELHGLLADSEVAAVFCARGGAGAVHLLHGLDPELVRRHPKPLLGSSDATCLHAIYGQAGVVSFHGPMVAMSIADGSYDPDSLRSALFRVPEPRVPAPLPLTCLEPGEARGRLRGGCLSLLSCLVGTRWRSGADDEGTILFVEDVNERPYRLDRMLFQLRAADALRGVTGIVFGEMPGCRPGEDEGYTLEEVLCEALQGFDGPVAFGLASGHTLSPGLTLPLGVRVALECTASEGARLVFEEPGVS
jgi:muramoyltetrapeptide carboxypeptidase